jgi:oligopeptide/dipeptide ABC transporter ATP-binding protein
MRLDGVNVLDADKDQLAQLRGRSAAMIFQDPMTAFDPAFSIGHQIVETIRAHRKTSKRVAWAEAEQLLLRVEIKNAADVLRYYPHQLSGGMLQRAMIAMALSCRPKILIADEPTTALDVTIQDQILKLILRLRRDLNMSVVLVTHDLGVIAQTCDRLAVMYAGRVVEAGPVADIFAQPRHAYTHGLLNSVPRGGALREPLSSIGGQPPSLSERLPGCAFAPRCSFVVTECTAAKPPLVGVAPMHDTACIQHRKVGQR